MQASLGTNWARSKTEVEVGANIDIIATPKVSIKIPVAPKWMGKLMKSSWFSPLEKLGEVWSSEVMLRKTLTIFSDS